VLLYCPSCNKGVRIGHRFTSSGQKERYCKKCSTGLGAVGAAKAVRATKPANKA
jgi:large subunit ribosomal protein L24